MLWTWTGSIMCSSDKDLPPNLATRATSHGREICARCLIDYQPFIQHFFHLPCPLKFSIFSERSIILWSDLRRQLDEWPPPSSPSVLSSSSASSPVSSPASSPASSPTSSSSEDAWLGHAPSALPPGGAPAPLPRPSQHDQQITIRGERGDKVSPDIQIDGP